MSIYINEIGGDAAVSQVNPGGKKQYLPKAAVEFILAKETHSFTDLADAKLEATWDTDKASKDIVPMYKIEELTANNSEETKFEGRFADIILKEAIKGSSYNMLLDARGYAALKSYDGSEYTRVFRILEDGIIECEAQDDGTIKGLPLSSLIVGQLLDTDLSKPQNVTMELKFKDHITSYIQPAFAIEDYEGIYDVSLAVDSSTATEIIATATSIDSNMSVGSFIITDWNLTGAGTLTSVSYSSVTEKYTFVSVGVITGDVLSLNGVVLQTGISYEAVKAVTLTV